MTSVQHKAQVEAAYRTAAQLTLILRPLTNDPKLLLKALDSIERCLKLLLPTQPLTEKSTGLSSQELKTLEQIFHLHTLHMQSALEFSKNGKAIILDESGNHTVLTVQNLLDALHIATKLKDKLI